ncbi:hypothetical protein D9619_007982 [Psilocybe cf. subviscida]|uniref:alpha-1,2-Mannosidase n=1 Tax=Psilocybe cf. subviscida TaxID=2480587 RepID=A0A8H5AUP8_9AGAR|nr:hypothetical protein D9619_007982 [Psilocybe cf. subviscida]
MWHAHAGLRFGQPPWSSFEMAYLSSYKLLLLAQVPMQATMYIPTFLSFFLLSLSLCQSGSAYLVQKPGLTVPSSDAQYKEQVKTMFRDSYAVYQKYAFGHDEVAPISGGFYDPRNGWGATIVDALSTMKVMGLDDLFTEGVKFASKIDFSKSPTSNNVSVFESSIRYIGGLLSAYELSGFAYPVLVEKSKQLADKLVYAWVGNNDVPYGFVDFSTNSPQQQVTNVAEAGSLTLEWATLSKYTKDDKYRKLAEKSALRIARNSLPLPGLPAQGLDPATGNPLGAYVTWGGGTDSYLEYLIKYPRLNSSVDATFVDSWRTAVTSSINTLMKKSIPGNHAYLADFDDYRNIKHIGSHLACFHGGNWLLGGKLLNNQTIVNAALDLVDACWNTYSSTATGIGPEQFAFVSSDGSYTGGPSPSAADTAFNKAKGFYITASDYYLRPEVLESNFYAWRVTGDTKYLSRAADATKSFQMYLRDPSGGYGGFIDVNNQKAARIDDTTSFWFAEVLKYLYLTFDDPSRFSLDNYVFNTEAHPLMVSAAPNTFGTGKLLKNPVHVLDAGSKLVALPRPSQIPAALFPPSIRK